MNREPEPVLIANDSQYACDYRVVTGNRVQPEDAVIVDA
jgi:hypothetical protein